MMTLTENNSTRSVKALLGDFIERQVDDDMSIKGISADSRLTRPGDLFLACKGVNTDGGRYVSHAVDAGARAIAIDTELMDMLPPSQLPIFPIRELHKKLGKIAARFYGYPSRELNLIGVTGTNGKTSITYWLAELYSVIKNRSAGLIGTLGYGKYPALESKVNTTPDAIQLHKLLADFHRDGMDAVFMEVSSHALAQHRVSDVDFNIAVFTNLSQDHLDYHKTMQAYADAKGKLFSFDSLKTAVVNYDDAYGQEIINRLDGKVDVISYGLTHDDHKGPGEPLPLISARVSANKQGGLSLQICGPWGGAKIDTRVLGSFNAYNLLGVIAVLYALDFSMDDVMEAVKKVSPVPGRMERLGSDEGVAIVIDYAHTPDALENALGSLRQICEGQLICVFGCGGSRDSAKRKRMGALAERYADRIILTDDNPRDEPAEQIIDDILSGISATTKITVERSRAHAIALAMNHAGRGDWVLVAGKGHERYQDIAGVRYPFSDRQQVRELLGKGR